MGGVVGVGWGGGWGGTWYLVLGTKYLVPSTTSTWYLVPSTWYLVLDTKCLVLIMIIPLFMISPFDRVEDLIFSRHRIG